MSNDLLPKYVRRTAPRVPAKLKGYLDVEFQNIMRGIPGSALFAVYPYGLQPGEVGVTDQRYPVGDIRRYGAMCDGTTDDATAINNAIASWDVITGPPGGTSLTSATHTLGIGQAFIAPGFTLLSSAAANALVCSDRSVAVGFKMERSGSAGSSVGIAVGTTGTTGHWVRLHDLEVTGFFDGVVVQLSFYGDYSGVDSHENENRNWRFTNVAIGDTLTSCNGRGGSTSKYGLVIDDTTSNCANITVNGGVFEGNSVQNVALLGADDCVFLGVHVEAHAPDSLTGTCTFTNASTAVTGVGTLFLTEVEAGQYVKITAHSGEFWRRVASITNNTSLTLDEVYDGATVAAAASVVAGDILIVGATGDAMGNQFLNPELGVASDSCPGVYFGPNADKNQVFVTRANLPIIVSRTANNNAVWANDFSGGLNDQGPDTQLWGPVATDQLYLKNGSSVAWRVTSSSAAYAAAGIRWATVSGFNDRGLYTGTGDPNGVVTARQGSLYTSEAGGANVTLWVKESGANTNTGWVAK